MMANAMARSRNSCVHPKRVTLIWVLSIFLFFCAFRFILNNSSMLYSSSSHDAPISNTVKRTKLYEEMAKDFEEHGLAFLKHGETSQSLSLSDLFSVKNGVVTPNLKAANPAVRANLLYLSTGYAIPISMAVKNIFSPYFDKAIWFQNSSLYHFSMFHASHHISPVHATHNEVEAEANAVRSVAESLCPLKIILDRVVLTSTGVLLGCWQVTSGSDPTTVRAKLRSVLPHAPEKQLYDASILHTSFARLLGPPTFPNREAGKASEDIKFFRNLVTRLNNQISGFQAMVSELWYVEEYDMLALALDGRMKIRRFQLSCSDTPET